MRLYGILENMNGGSFILQISSDLNNFKESDNIYYTDKDFIDTTSVYSPYIDSTWVDWQPYNCVETELELFFKDGKWYEEGAEPDGAMMGARESYYKEGKLIKQRFIPY